MENKVYLRAESIYTFLTSDHEELDRLIMFQDKAKLVTSDQSLYEALGSIEDKTKININKLVKLLEVAQINSFEHMMKSGRTILKEGRADEIKEKAMKIMEGSI